MNTTPITTRFFKRALPLAPYVLCFLLLVGSNSFLEVAITNGLVQIVLFLLVVNIPAFLTKRMSYVDIGWPWGLVAIGVITLILGDGYWLRKVIICVLYALAGLRMGVFAVKMYLKGHLKQELPRYAYQRKRWEKGGYQSLDISLQYEVSIQSIANITFLALPAMFQAFNSTPYLTPVELLGYGIWVLSFGTEHLADLQKVRFARKAHSEGRKGACCDVGLWKYSRHPNYFAEWMVWNALILSSLPSVFFIYEKEPLWVWAGLSVGLLFISRLLYLTLVYYTGAIPSEYYSLQKRPEYKSYQQRTNMFFPGRNRP